MYQLDFTIQDAQKRAELVRSFDLSDVKAKDLELIANYLCFGKDNDGTSPVDRHEIQITTRYSHFQRKNDQSLDELLESPNFNEATLSPLGGTRYRKSFSRSFSSDIPNVAELQSDIELLQQRLSALSPSSKEYYVLRHEIIDLRQRRYQIRDEWCKPISAKNSPLVQEPLLIDMRVMPNGVMCAPYDRQFGLRQHSEDACVEFNFENAQHIAQLIKMKQDLEGEGQERELLWTLDYYVERANLKPKLRIVLEGKVAHWTSQEIVQKIQEETGIGYSFCYVSMMWKMVLRRIVESVKLVRDEIAAQGDESAWQVCRCCGEKKLKDKRCFTKKGGGLSKRCKECDRKMRQGQ